MSQKSIQKIITPPPTHWVGDGFKVHNFIPGAVSWEQISPFVMLDYNAKVEFEPSHTPRGVGVHPHRGFETVTIAYQGKVAHHDSAGNSGIIGEGEVQWMTAGSGILHKEYHEQEFTKRGGVFQMVQLWVNLPAKDKMTEPKYQALTKDQIVKIELPQNQGQIQLIAGEFQNQEESFKGPAFTFSPVNLFNLRLNPEQKFHFDQPSNYNTAVLVIDGNTKINGQDVKENELVLFAGDGTEIEIEAAADGVTVLVLSGEPLNEQIAAYGPFIMNTKQQILEAFEDFQAGKFGELAG